MQWANHDLAMCRQAFDHGDKSPATSNVSYECPKTLLGAWCRIMFMNQTLEYHGNIEE